jgi:hypothetical protein
MYIFFPMKFHFYTLLFGFRHSGADLRRPPRRSFRQNGFILVKRTTASCFLLASSRVYISSFSVSNDRSIWFWGVRVSKAWVCLHLSWRWRGSPSHWPTVFSNSSLSLHMESLYSFCYSVMPLTLLIRRNLFVKKRLTLYFCVINEPGNLRFACAQNHSNF